MNVTVDDNVAVKANELLDEFGMDMKTAVNVFLRQMIRDKSIPFTIDIPGREEEIDDDDYFSGANLEHLRRSIAQAKAGQVVYHDLIEAE
ncbi:MAG: type II toxin-antitoxin system RelB/DinJ family antitoxin [Synergistaceae bacterium]|nr:type II toxin-antitoxin system RelB/DinJ family antitoxin [Synergistaceae bacterium]MBQ9628884.1 type II toxin-antitoxin system RelB/DinJ family antitoxin [Synergistaceae bacterium]MBR0070595.1 type II toxin-antitoxin system RelB/DinJ family antitoxin [Synergistaceae bacterium]MBR0250175.1 type II toxin-antitoxin system RelB/DinJ family antitoxin [Synergistaceae bacterium]MBR0251059.1 type II toxin-antitoxin system RelB/DinJ family antitoxin [Synergistaceae bacterium]